MANTPVSDALLVLNLAHKNVSQHKMHLISLLLMKPKPDVLLRTETANKAEITGIVHAEGVISEFIKAKCSYCGPSRCTIAMLLNASVISEAHTQPTQLSDATAKPST